MSKQTAAVTRKEFNQQIEDHDGKISDLLKIINGPTSEPQKGLVMMTHDNTKAIKLQTKLMWIIIGAFIAAGASKFLGHIDSILSTVVV